MFPWWFPLLLDDCCESPPCLKGLIVIHELVDRGDAGLSIGFDEAVFFQAGMHFLMVLKRTACPSQVLRSPGR